MSYNVKQFAEKLGIAIRDGNYDYFTDNVCALVREYGKSIVIPSVEIEVNYPSADDMYRQSSVIRKTCREVSPILYAVNLVHNKTDNHYRVLQKLLDTYPTDAVNSSHKLWLFSVSEPTTLHLAAASNNVHAAELLLQHGADMQQLDSSYGGLAPIHVAARCSSVDILRLLIKQGCDVNLESIGNLIKNPAAFASEAGHTDVLRVLVKSGAEIDGFRFGKSHAIHLAAAGGHTSCVQILLEVGLSFPDWPNEDSETPVQLASRGGHAEVLTLLIQHGAMCDIPYLDTKPPLHLAVENGHIRCVQILLNAGADIDSVDKYGNTAVHMASKIGNAELLKLLIDRGAKEDISNSKAKRPLHVAAVEGHASCVEILLDTGSEIDSHDEHSNTAVHLASKAGHPEALSFLISRGATINITNSVEERPLHLAAAKGHPACIQILLDAGASIDSVDENGSTALHRASNAGQAEVLQLRIRNKAITNIPNEAKKRRNPLHLAAGSDYTDCVRNLLEAGADVNCLDKQGRCTPLQSASEVATDANSHTVKLLIEYGSSLNYVDKSGKTALHHAIEHGATKAVKVLIEAGCHLNTFDANGKNYIAYTVLSTTKIWLRKVLRTIRILFEGGCDVYACDKEGNSALHYASASDRYRSVKLLDFLVKLGRPDKNVLNTRGKSVVMCGIANSRTDNVLWLLDNGFDVKTPDKSGKAPLRLAAEKDLPEVVKAMLQKYESTNKIDYNKTLLRYGGDRVLNLLLEQQVGAFTHDDSTGVLYVRSFRDLGFHSRHAYLLAKRMAELADVMDERHRTHYFGFIREIIKWDARNRLWEILGIAIQMVPATLCKLVITKRNWTSRINSLNENSETPLAIAVNQNSLSKCKLLIENGARVDGDVLLSALSHGMDHRIVDLLLEAAEGKSFLRDVIKQSCFVNESIQSLAHRSKSKRLQSLVDSWGLRHGFGRRFHQKSHCLSTLKKHTNSYWSRDIEIRHSDGYWLTQFVQRCRLTSQCAEAQRIVDAVSKWLNQVSKYFENDPRTEHLAFTPKLVGSMAEGTKTFLPNELDFICELNTVKCKDKDAKNGKKGIILLPKAGRKGVYLMHGERKLVHGQKLGFKAYDPRELANNFYDWISTIDYASFSSHANLVLHKTPLQLRDKLSCVHLLWNGTVFQNMMIYIDLVPAIRLPQTLKAHRYPPYIARDLPRHAIAKKSRYSFHRDRKNCIFPYSFSLHEAAFTKELPEQIRNGYTLAKAVRQADICAIDTTSAYLQYHDPDEPLYIADVITTYMLKTCLFFLYREHKFDYRSTVLQQSEYAWAVRIYRKVREFFREGKLPTYYGDGVLFQCRHVGDNKGTTSRLCCHKRVFILRMCDAIIQWLHKHQTELQELEDVYDDCRLEVYSRN